MAAQESRDDLQMLARKIEREEIVTRRGGARQWVNARNVMEPKILKKVVDVFEFGFIIRTKVRLIIPAEVTMDWSDRPTIQQKILAFLYDIHAERKPALSFRDIANKLGGISTNTVDYHVKKMERDGLVTRDNKTARSLRLTEQALARFNLPDWVHLPLLGKIKAGSPSPVPDSGNSHYDAERPMVAILRSDLPNGNFNNLFALDVQGDSMIDAGVFDGDRIVVRHLESPRYEIRNGDMVVAWLNKEEETTLKRYYCIEGKVELRPENPHYDTIPVEPKNLEIRGKLIHVARQVR